MKVVWRRLRAPLTLFAIVASLCGVFASVGLRINLTRSLPRGIYLKTHELPQPGLLVAVCLPHGVAREGRRRGYLLAGNCPGEASPVLKQIAAGEGEWVRIEPEGISVDGHLVQAPAPVRDSRGRCLHPLSNGEYPIQHGEIWLLAHHPQSWDSRYYGPVSVSSVLGVMRPLWTETFPREREPSARPQTFPRNRTASP